MLIGLGNVGRSFLQIIQSQHELLAERYDAAFRIVAAADSGGVAFAVEGLDPAALLGVKARGGSVAGLPGGRAGVPAVELAERVAADALLEATPVDLRTAEPGLSVVRAALGRGIPVVLANKGPLALRYRELAARSDLADPGAAPLRFSACVGGAMPTINLGIRDLAGARVVRAEAVLNGTTQFILRSMEAGLDYADALADARRRGLTETDPSLDVGGWDAAAKLVILANSVLRQPATIADVRVEGIGRVTRQALTDAAARDQRIVLLCLAERKAGNGGYRLSVRPTALATTHPLARMDADEMGVVYYTDIAGRLCASSAERDPVPTAAAMLRDLLDVIGRGRGRGG